MTENTPKIGDLKVWHIPQVPGKAFEVPVKDVYEGVKIMDILANYDLFQLHNHIKPDYCNVSGLSVYEADSDGAGNPGWSDWYFETPDDYYDDPRQYVADHPQA
jgi:hypothetical protein